MDHKNIKIKNKYNKNLAVILNTPKGDIKDYIIFNHCFTCSKDYKIYNYISKVLSNNGYASVRFDMMALGESKGNFEDTSFVTNVEDVISIYDYIKDNYKAPRYFLGHSLGGLISIKASELLPNIKGIATIGSPFDFTGLKNRFSKYNLADDDKINITIAGRNFAIGKRFIEDIESQDMELTIKNFDKSIIIFHSNTDEVVDYKLGLKLFNTINSDKSFITLNNTNHLVSEQKDAYYIGNILSNWLDKVK